MSASPKFAGALAAPNFSLGLRCTDTAIEAIEFLPPQAPIAGKTPLAREALRQLQAWLEDARFRFDLPLVPAGSDFQRRVWQQISAIPCGETRSYGDLARALGTAPRAVGGACGANPYPIVVPCHRIVSASGMNGGLGGFAHARDGFLLDVKRWLLQHERSR